MAREVCSHGSGHGCTRSAFPQQIQLRLQSRKCFRARKHALAAPARTSKLQAFKCESHVRKALSRISNSKIATCKHKSSMPRCAPGTPPSGLVCTFFLQAHPQDMDPLGIFRHGVASGSDETFCWARSKVMLSHCRLARARCCLRQTWHFSLHPFIFQAFEALCRNQAPLEKTGFFVSRAWLRRLRSEAPLLN